MARWFVPTVDLTQSDEDENSHMSCKAVQLPASAIVASDTSALVTFSQVEGNLLRNVSSPHLAQSQPGVNSWQPLYPTTHPQGLPAVLGPQVQLVTQRALEALNSQRVTALCFFDKEKLSLLLNNTKRLRVILMSVLRQLEQEAGEGTVISGFKGSISSSWEIRELMRHPKYGGKMRNCTTYVHTELSLQKTREKRFATRISTHVRRISKKWIDFHELKKNFYEKYGVKSILRFNCEGIGQTWNPMIQDIRRTAINSRDAKRNCAKL